MFMDDHSDAQIAPSGNFSNTTTLNCDNPLLSAQELATDLRPGNMTFTRPASSIRPPACLRQLANRSASVAATSKAAAATTISSTPTIASSPASSGDLLQRPVLRRLLPVRHDAAVADLPERLLGHAPAARDRRHRQPGGGGVPGVPGSERRSAASVTPGGGDPNCVPYDIFATGGVTPAALELPADPGLPARQRQRDDRRREHHGRWRRIRPAVAVGGPRRRHQRRRRVSQGSCSNFRPDIEFQTGDLAGQGGPTLPVTGRSTFASCSPRSRCRSSATPSSRSSRSTGGYRYSDYKVDAATASTRTPTRSRPSSRRSATSASAPATTARSARRTSSNCSSRRALALAVAVDPCAGARLTGTATTAQCAQHRRVTAAQYGRHRGEPGQPVQRACSAATRT